jgi:hypothetical protein
MSRMTMKVKKLPAGLYDNDPNPKTWRGLIPEEEETNYSKSKSLDPRRVLMSKLAQLRLKMKHLQIFNHNFLAKLEEENKES